MPDCWEHVAKSKASNPENEKLVLPSDLGAGKRMRLGLEFLAEEEARLHEAHGIDLIARLQYISWTINALNDRKIVYTRGQDPRTKSFKLWKTQQDMRTARLADTTVTFGSSPSLQGAPDNNARKGLVRHGYDLSTASTLMISGGVTIAVVLPGGQAFVIKLRPTSERSPSSMLLEPPFSFNGSGIEPFNPPRCRQLKQACGRGYSYYERARKIKVQQDAFCPAALSGNWGTIGGSTAKFPEDLQWEALVDVLRGRVKIQNLCYEAVDLDGIIRLTNETMFNGEPPAVALFSTDGRYKREAYRGSGLAPKVLAENGLAVAMKSDPVPNSRYLLHEAQQAHYSCFLDNLALAAVTTTLQKLWVRMIELDIKEGYYADLVLWDSHPLSLGATSKQVFIDRIAQLEHPHVTSDKPLKSQRRLKLQIGRKKREWQYSGIDILPLGPKESFRTGSDGQVVLLVNAESIERPPFVVPTDTEPPIDEDLGYDTDDDELESREINSFLFWPVSCMRAWSWDVLTSSQGNFSGPPKSAPPGTVVARAPFQARPNSSRTPLLCLSLLQAPIVAMSNLRQISNGKIPYESSSFNLDPKLAGDDNTNESSPDFEAEGCTLFISVFTDAFPGLLRSGGSDTLVMPPAHPSGHFVYSPNRSL
ncbi:hypothetical protein K435DRAFT_867785 [Dendrothele bispora CBS 962.96]|uniref:Uncharacterized protein n=1 Tax=Dendrothele bispora (strain CBS 962.96) TaxID=1314807 RepID=A0A4S8LDH5_DENBC|nr:hypothetical protein K435DRAFT_867785 [Dendrothele bispora CBS 962.96]